MSSPLFQPTVEIETTLMRVTRIGEERHVMSYSIAGGKSFNMVLAHPESLDPSTWNQKTVIEDMKKHFEGWDPW